MSNADSMARRQTSDRPRASATDRRRRAPRAVRTWLAACAGFALLLLQLVPAHALKPIPIPADAERIDITSLADIYEGRGDSLQLETATAADGASGRMSVRAATAGTNPNWMVFALQNTTDKPMERWLTADRYTVIGSGAVWPDLDARRIEAVTPSIGFVPERVKSDRADLFRITLEPGQMITFAAEMSSERFARVYLWKPLDYEIKVRDRQLFNGIMLGLTGLLAIFLTAIFAANHKAIFPSAALVSWCVLCYLCVDFGFFHKLFNLRPEDNAVYRAAGEAAMGASLVVFLHTFLRLGLWHGLVRMLIAVWMLAQFSLIAVAVVDPRLAATFARLSFIAIGAIGALFTLFLAVRGQDRAMSLIPTWLLFLVWIFGAGVILTGRLSGDIVVSGLVAGLVLIVVLIGFTVTQYAFRSLEPVYGAAPSEAQLRALAVDGASAAVWEWNARRDEVKVSPLIETSLGLNPGELNAKVEDFVKHLHPGDRERFRLMLWSIQERAGGNIKVDFRMRHADNSYRCFELEASSVPSTDRKSVRCLGLVRDITDQKRAHERLLHDAVHCSLTGIPYRALLLDRLTNAIQRAKADTTVRPTLLFIDIDKFKSVNTSFGLVVGDSLLLTTARRLQRHLGPQDTLARVGGDQFAILIVNEQDPRDLAQLAERIRRSLRSPIKIAGQEIVLTGSLGIAVYDGTESEPSDLLKEAEIAMYRAKRGGADRIEIFRPEMRAERDDRVAIESDLRKAIEKGQLKVFYQPIVQLPNEELVGFEALVRWEHPKLGLLNPARFVPVAEESDLIVKLGSYVLLTAAREAARWQKEMPRPGAPLFVSVNVSSRQLFRQDLIQEIRHILGREIVPRGALKLEVTESLVMENPEQATEMLELLRAAGADLSLDDFGTGYSSLAYLQRFPFDTIKLDRALVQATGAGDTAGAAIVRSMVALAHELGKSVVAEGVETAEDVGFLRGIGCEYAQGYYYGAPIADRDVIQLLRMVQKSERKLQPRGFFRMGRTKSKSAETTKKTKTAETTPLPASSANGAEKPRAPVNMPGASVKPRPKSGKPAQQQPAAAPSPAPLPQPPPLAAAPPMTPAPEAPRSAPPPQPGTVTQPQQTGRPVMQPAVDLTQPAAPAPAAPPPVAAHAPPPAPPLPAPVAAHAPPIAPVIPASAAAQWAAAEMAAHDNPMPFVAPPPHAFSHADDDGAIEHDIVEPTAQEAPAPLLPPWEEEIDLADVANIPLEPLAPLPLQPHAAPAMPLGAQVAATTVGPAAAEPPMQAPAAAPTAAPTAAVVAPPRPTADTDAAAPPHAPPATATPRPQSTFARTDTKALSPSIAASLAKLAGAPTVPKTAPPKPDAGTTTQPPARRTGTTDRG